METVGELVNLYWNNNRTVTHLRTTWDAVVGRMLKFIHTFYLVLRALLDDYMYSGSG
jgi:hypothetical protein